jgi:heme oxygenase
MLPLKEAIAEKHSLAEKMPFNQKMFKGELSKEEYIGYLCQQLGIFDAIEEDRNLPHPSLNRVDAVYEDIKELVQSNDDQTLEIELLSSAKTYYDYLKSLDDVQILPHIYINYLALMFGGQMMKAKTPGSGKMYEFDGDVKEIVGSIRAIQKDEWADEANKALDFNIAILDELQRVSESLSL